MRFIKLFLLGFLMISQAAHSTQWLPGYDKSEIINQDVQLEAALIEARLEFNKADSRANLENSIAAYRKVLSMDDSNLEALTALSSQYILLGTAYEDSKSKKRKKFRRGRFYAEQAMLTNSDFKAKVEGGAEIWEAAETLREPEFEAGMLWVTSMQYEFKETMGTFARIFKISRLKYTLPILHHIEETSPDYAGGSVHFALAITYLFVPQSLGGNDELGMKYLTDVFNNNPDWMLGRWAKGIYYEDLVGDNTGVVEVLSQVASADINQYKDSYPWKVHFVQSASELLDEL